MWNMAKNPIPIPDPKPTTVVIGGVTPGPFYTDAGIKFIARTPPGIYGDRFRYVRSLRVGDKIVVELMLPGGATAFLPLSDSVQLMY